MAYIEAHQALLTHRKTLRLGRLLNLDKYAVVGRLMALWWWALDNAPDGTINGADSDILEDVMGWDGAAGELCMALISSGFLERDGGDYRIHDWDEYAGKLMERRKANAKRQQDWRERHVTGESDTHNAHVTVTSPSRNGANVTKRSVTERENATSAADAASSRSPTPTPTPSPAPTSPVAPSAEPSPAPKPKASVKPPQDAAPPPSPNTPGKPRAVNATWDALVEALGYEPQTKPEKSNWGKAVKDLNEAGATPEDIALRAGHYVSRYGRDMLTVNALVNRWGECAVAPAPYAARASPNGHSATEPPKYLAAGAFDPWKS